MDPTAAAAAQPTVMWEKFLTEWGPAMQAFGFLGWFILAIAAIAFAVAFIVLVPSLRRAALEYARWVEAQIGPRAEMEDIVQPSAKDEKDVDVDQFVE